MKVINFFGEGGVGKSTRASGLYAEMKRRGYNVELATEWVKKFFYVDEIKYVPNQLLITGQQIDQLKRLEGHVDYVIIDSPVYLGAIYCKLFDVNYALSEAIKHEFFKFDNYNILLERDFDFNPKGRGSGNTARVVRDMLANELQYDKRYKSSELTSYTKLIKDIVK